MSAKLKIIETYKLMGGLVCLINFDFFPCALYLVYTSFTIYILRLKRIALPKPLLKKEIHKYIYFFVNKR